MQSFENEPFSTPTTISETMNQQDVIDWFHNTGLLQERTITAINIIPLRKVAALITLDDGQAFFMKQMFSPQILTRASAIYGFTPLTDMSSREAELLQYVFNHDEMSACRSSITLLHHIDHEKNIIVTEGLIEYQTLQEYCQFYPPTEQRIQQRIAVQLAQFHQLSQSNACQQEHRLYLHPPIPTYGHITPRVFANAVGRDYPRYLQSVQSVNDALRMLKQTWQPTCLIHGDFKCDNILLRQENNTGLTIKFIDWELSGWGDPLWDLGSLIGHYLLYWVLSISIDSPTTLASWIEHAHIPFHQFQNAASTLVQEYFLATSSLQIEISLISITQYIGLFLIHRAQVILETVGSMDSHVYCCLFIGKNLLQRPASMRKILFAETF